MTFATGYKKDPGKVGGGEIHGGSHVILGSSNFENGLLVGRFAKVETGDALHNLDGSSTPTIAGVIMRQASYPVEDGSAIDSSLYANVSAVLHGLVAVEAVSSDTPGLYAPLYAVNASGSGANFGKATTTSTNNVLTGARFIEKITDDVWLVHMTGQPPSGVTVNVNMMPTAYTVATVPAAGDNTGLLIYVSDGAAGEPVLARSNGTNWVRMDGSGDNIAAS